MTLASSTETPAPSTSDATAQHPADQHPADQHPPVVHPRPGGPARRSRTGGRVRRFGARAAWALVALWGAATVAFFAQVLLPGDRATIIFNIRAGQPIERTGAELAAVNAEYGLQHPVLVQYADYVTGLLRGDLGDSYQQHRPVAAILLEQVGPTLLLTFSAIALAWLFMVVSVVLNAGRRGWGSVGAALEVAAAGLPHYWLGIILLLVLALDLGWFPVVGGNSLAGLFLPALTLAIPLAGFLGQATRSAFETALEQPFVLTARTRGASDLSVRARHVLRHALLPAVTLSGWALGATISGAVVVEAVFTRSGIGSVLVSAVNSQDLPIVTGVVVLVAALYVVANLVVDLVHTLLDPRLKAS